MKKRIVDNKKIVFFNKLQKEPPLGFETCLEKSTSCALSVEKNEKNSLKLFLTFKDSLKNFEFVVPMNNLEGKEGFIFEEGIIKFPSGENVYIGSSAKNGLAEKIRRHTKMDFDYKATPGEVWIHLKSKHSGINLAFARVSFKDLCKVLQIKNWEGQK